MARPSVEGIRGTNGGAPGTGPAADGLVECHKEEYNELLSQFHFSTTAAL